MLVDRHDIIVNYIHKDTYANKLYMNYCVCWHMLIDTAVLCVRKCRHITTLVYVWLVVWIIFDFPYFVNNNPN